MSTSPALLLVHGAWHGSWCWDAVRPLLEHEGRSVHTVDLPTVHHVDKAALGLADDVAAVREAIDAIGGAVIVVAHSYGGIPATVAADAHPDVRHLVYLAAFALDTDESLLAAVGGEAPSWWRTSDDLISAGTDAEPAAGIFYNDLPPAQADAVSARLLPQSRSVFSDTLTAAAWHSIPSTYIVTAQDHAIPPFAQEHLAARAGSTVRHIDAGHSPFLSRPDETARLILDAGSTS